MEKLKEIVSKVFDTNINIKTRKRNNVEARMIFSKILREDGNTFESIGKAINKDHSTIVYYVNQASVLIKQSIELSDKYLECKNCYIDNLDVVLPQMKYDELKDEVVELKLLINQLTIERNEIIKVQEKYNRIKKIINLVAERTHVGKEEFIERKINQMFNGI
jgi:chromosomal replication initiation ATPase DnaA